MTSERTTVLQEVYEKLHDHSEGLLTIALRDENARLEGKAIGVGIAAQRVKEMLDLSKQTDLIIETGSCGSDCECGCEACC